MTRNLLLIKQWFLISDFLYYLKIYLNQLIKFLTNGINPACIVD